MDGMARYVRPARILVAYGTAVVAVIVLAVSIPSALLAPIFVLAIGDPPSLFGAALGGVVIGALLVLAAQRLLRGPASRLAFVPIAGCLALETAAAAISGNLAAVLLAGASTMVAAIPAAVREKPDR